MSTPNYWAEINTLTTDSTGIFIAHSKTHKDSIKNSCAKKQLVSWNLLIAKAMINRLNCLKFVLPHVLYTPQ